MKLLDISQILTDFDGTPLTEDGQPLTLKRVLLMYLRYADGLSLPDEVTAYELGVKVAQGTDVIELEQHPYDVLKKLCDSGKVKIGMQVVEGYNLVARQGAKQLVDAAKTKEEKPADAGEKA